MATNTSNPDEAADHACGECSETEARLQRVSERIERLPESSQQLRLQLQLELLRSRLVSPNRREATLLKWIKVLTPTVATIAAAWTLWAGISEFRRASVDRENAPFLAALAMLSDTASEASRLTAIFTIAQYAERPNFYSSGKRDLPSRAEEVGMLLGLRMARERSPLLRQLYSRIIENDDTLLQIGLSTLMTENAGATESRSTDVGISTSPPDEDQLRLSAEAIAEILDDLERGVNQTVAAMLNGQVDSTTQLSLRLRGVNLHSVVFGRLDLRGSDFSGDTLDDVDFSQVELDSAAAATICASVDENVRLPDQYGCNGGHVVVLHGPVVTTETTAVSVAPTPRGRTRQ